MKKLVPMLVCYNLVTARGIAAFGIHRIRFYAKSLLPFPLGAVMALLAFGLIEQRANADSYTNVIPQGYSLIANQLDHGSNTADVVFSNTGNLDFSSISKWNCSAFTVAYFDSTSPSGFSDSGANPIPAPTVKPGEAFFFNNQSGSTQTLTFTGTPHVPVLPATLPCGYGHANYLSRQTNDVGTYQNVVGLPPTSGAQELVWNGAGYVTYTYTNGIWTPTNPPTLAIGQGAVFIVPTNTPPVILVYQGLTNTAVGNAFIANQLDHGSNTLYVANLGTNGQDGVSIAAAPNTSLDVGWLPLDPSNALPVGAFVQTRMIGATLAFTNGVLGTLTTTKAGTGNYVATANFTALGASSATVQLYNGSTRVAQLTGQTGVLYTVAAMPYSGGGSDDSSQPADCSGTCDDAHPPPSGWACCITVRPQATWNVATTFVLNGTAYLGTSVVVTPEGPPVSGIVTAQQILAANIPSLTITRETVSLVYQGLTNTALGNAFIANQLDHGSNTLYVANLGTNGQDGVKIALNPGNNFAGSWLPLDPSDALPVGAYVQCQMIGTAGTVINGLLGSTRCTKLGTSNYVITVDYSPLGSSSHTVQVYNGSVLVAQVTGQTGALCATVKLPPGTCTINTELNMEWPKPTLITISGGSTVLGTGILMIPEGGASISSITAEQILAANIPSITITSESVSVTYAGLIQTALGNAALIANQLDHGSNRLDVINIGSSGQDGVSIALPGNLALDVGWKPLDSSNTLPVGAYVQERIIGTANGITNGALGTVTMTKAGTSNYVVSADWTPIGVTHYTVQAYRNGVLVAQATNQNGASLAVCNIWGDSGCIPLPPILGGGSDWETNQTGGPLPLVTIGGGASLTCDHLYVIPESVSGTPNALQITASGVSSISMTAVTVSPVLVGLTKSNQNLTLQWFGTGVLQQSSNLKNWSAVSGATSPYVVPMSGTNQFYRIIQPVP